MASPPNIIPATGGTKDILAGICLLARHFLEPPEQTQPSLQVTTSSILGFRGIS